MDAIANKRAGRQLDPTPDIVADFNSARTDWYFGTDGNTPADEYDFTPVVMHAVRCWGSSVSRAAEAMPVTCR